MGNEEEQVFTSCDVGGPMFVHVRGGRVVRVRPIIFSPDDTKSWTIKVGGRAFMPQRKTTMAPFTQTFRRRLYSPARIKYPLRRADFDPEGDRHPETRGKGDYVRISWNEAMDIVAGEVRRVKETYGPSAIYSWMGGHFMWGFIHYHMSAHIRFFDFIGHTVYIHNPDSWEGWYWGASHIWGHPKVEQMRLGNPEQWLLLEDALKNSDLIVHWSNDPDSVRGLYGGQESAIWRLWLRELGKKQIFIDPFCNYTAAILADKWIAPRPGTDTALAAAISYVWIDEGTYDKEYVETHSSGFDKWKKYIQGGEDSIQKTPKWAEEITGVQARVIKALAREWASKKTMLTGYFNGVGRQAYGHEWSRMMVLLQTMQGLGKPGVNMWSTMHGAPQDQSFKTWGYGDGGMNYVANKNPENPVTQGILRILLPDAILNPPIQWHGGMSSALGRQGIRCIGVRGPLQPYKYPQPGNSEIRLIYKAGASCFGTLPDTNQYAKAYQSPKIEFMVYQVPWMAPEAKFADIILPTCTSLERNDISEWAKGGTYGPSADFHTSNNHRIVIYHKKCVEPLYESKSDYDIFVELAERLGFKDEYTEGNSEEDWIKKMFEQSDLPRYISYEKFKEKGYFVIPIPDDYGTKEFSQRSPFNVRAMRRFYLTGGGLQTPSGKIEFSSQILDEWAPDDKERPPVPHYIESWEGHTSELATKYPLQLITPHPRFQYHTHYGHVSWIKEIPEHRIYKDGYYWWPIRIHPSDAKKRAIKNEDIVKVYNDRATVLCIAFVTERVRPGVVHSYEAGWYDPLEPGKIGSIDKGGEVNLLAPLRRMSKNTAGMAPNSCLVELSRWEG